MYRNNPFRRLGLSVLATPREIAKRCDQLKLSSELGMADKTRAFAPTKAPTVDEVRECAQQLQDPTQRLLCEFFWFWPTSYPELGDDAGMQAIEKGDPEEAFSCWLRGLSKGEPAAMHNMAVYFHLIALDWELGDQRSPRSDPEMWEPALKYWRRVIGGDGIWERLARRTQTQVDASMHGDFPAQLRAQLPALLAGINAQWALQFAERGLLERTRQHSDMVLSLHGDAAEGRRALEDCAASSVRRIDARVADCRRVAASAPETLLPLIVSLLMECETEIRLIEGFCGTGTQRSRELCQGLTAGVLDALVAYQRKTQDNSGSLPLFLHLLDKPATPELQQRATEAFEVVYTNAIAAERKSDKESATAGACRLLLGCLIPSERLLNFSRPSRAPYRARIGGLLSRLSEATAANLLAANLGSKALSSAAALLTSPENATPFRISASACALEIGAEGIVLNGNRVALSGLVGLRHGFSPEGAPIVAWSSFTEAWEVDFSALGVSPAEVLPLYTATVVALDHFVRPALTTTLLGWLRSGEDVHIGDLRLHKSGLKVSAGADAQVIPFSQLLAGQDAASLHLSSRGSINFSTTLECGSTWNAAIIAQVIDTLAGDVETRAR